MNPKILLIGCGTFFACLLTHVLVWRLRRPRNDMAALFVIFIFVPLGLACLWGWFDSGFSAVEFAAAGLFHLAVSCAYIQSYPPAQAESPSLKMLILIAQHMPQGLTREEVLGHFDNIKLVGTRFQDLVNNNLICRVRGSFYLTPVAKSIILFFVLYRKLLGLEFKGG